MYIMSRENCQEMDSYAIQEIGTPSIVLMENVANEVVLKIKQSLLIILEKWQEL